MSSATSKNMGTHPHTAPGGNNTLLTKPLPKSPAPPRTQRGKAAMVSGFTSESSVVTHNGLMTMPDNQLAMSMETVKQGKGAPWHYVPP